jgi:hypothetical protein
MATFPQSNARRISRAAPNDSHGKNIWTVTRGANQVLVAKDQNAHITPLLFTACPTLAGYTLSDMLISLQQLLLEHLLRFGSVVGYAICACRDTADEIAARKNGE